MEPLEIARRIQQRFANEVLETVAFMDQVGVLVRRERIVEILAWLKDSPDLAMNHLMDLCGVDNARRPGTHPERFEVVYNLYSIDHRHQIRIRALVPEQDPVIDSVTPLWAGADWHERECFDLMGIRFAGHGDLRRILLPDDWSGHPLRKEYPLKGRDDWPGFDELKNRISRINQFGFGHPVTADRTNGDQQQRS